MTQDSQEDKEKEMQNIIEDKDRISEKIGEFQKKYNQKSVNENDSAKSSAFGLAMRITTDLMSGVIIGGIMGWSFDKLFGTSPWLLIVFFILGVAAGISNVIRTANKMNKLGQLWRLQIILAINMELDLFQLIQCISLKLKDY